MAKVAADEMPAEAGSVTLLQEEGGMMAYCGAVTTITFFTGPAPVEAVRERLTLVVAANPWLAAVLRRTSRSLRTVRTGYVHRPHDCTYAAHIPASGVPYVPHTVWCTTGSLGASCGAKARSA